MPGTSGRAEYVARDAGGRAARGSPAPILAAFAALILWLGVARAAPSPPPGASPSGRPLFNVLLIVVDTLGAEQVGCLGGLARTPVIDRLAKEGVLFRRAYATSPWTKPSIASLLTGLLPSRHGVKGLFDRLPDRCDTLAEGMRRAGLRTGGVVSNWLLQADHGFAQGFGSYDDSLGGSLPRAITSAAVTDKAIRWLDAHGGAPFFLFVHYFDPHCPYRHHAAFDRTVGYDGRLREGVGIRKLHRLVPKLTPADVAFLVGLHREEIAYTDHHVGRLLAHLEALGAADRTLVILTADHGEEFMRHGWIGHHHSLYEELIHVPLIIRLPGSFPARSVAEPVSILDVVPTLVAMAPTSSPVESDGISLLPVLRGELSPSPNREIVAEVSFTPAVHGTRHREKAAFKTAVLRGDHKVVHDLETDAFEAYDLASDPREATNLYGRAPWAENLIARVRELERTEGAGGGPAPESRVQPGAADTERLRALGYGD